MATMRARRPHARVAAPLAWLTTVIVALGLLAGGTAQAAVRDGSADHVESVQSGQAADSVVKTADLSQFQAGNIISDAVFFDKSTMTADQIQAFLQSKVSTCQSGYTCLKDWYDTSRTTSADAMCGAYSGGVRERASTIIYKVAQACGINPRVLVVMLEKEQGLVTHTWPSDWRYTIAMGQGCPDTAGCDTKYYGFFNQVYGAAWQLKRYGNPPGTSQYFTWYAPGKTWNVRYNPDAACGSSPVLIQNQATANLYYYTPYQPNAAALRAGYGEGDGCSAYGNRNFYQRFTDWFGSTVAVNPFGNVELVEALPGKFRVAGWAADPETSLPISVHVYVGAAGTAFTANVERPDVGGLYPQLGSAHGFDVEVAASGGGPTRVCVYAINSGMGGNVLLACNDRAAMSGPPLGVMGSATAVDAGIAVSGWAIDPDTTSPIPVHVYVDDAGTAVSAGADSSEALAAHPAYGAKHGFNAKVSASPGSHDVCAYAINAGPGGNVLLGCATVVVPGQSDLGRPPFGSFEALTVSGATATASGWAIDPDTSSPIKVHLYVGNVGAVFTADKPRPDVGSQYPAAGPNHGFSEVLTLPAGPSQVCAYAINNGAGGHTQLGCKTVTVASVQPDLGRPPFGSFEALTVSGATATASGWAIDPDTSSPIKVHLYVGSVGAVFTADKPRPDVGSQYPAAGPNHGFSEVLTLPAGPSQVCAYAINNGAGGHTQLGCKTVTVASVQPDLGRPPFGSFEALTVNGATATASGWAIDPDTSSPIKVHVYVDSVGVAYTADVLRADVGNAYPGSGSQHGFIVTIPMTVGTHHVCVYAINSGAGGHTPLGCRDATIP